jgi:hypothetical protein
VLEELRNQLLGKFVLILDDKRVAIIGPSDKVGVFTVI